MLGATLKGAGKGLSNVARRDSSLVRPKPPAAARAVSSNVDEAAEAASKSTSFSKEALSGAGFDAKQVKTLQGMATDAGAANRVTTIASINAMMKGATPAQKQILQQALKNMGAKRSAYGFAFRPDGSVKIGNIVKVAASTGIAGVVAWLTFRGLGGVPGSEQLGDIVDETDPNAGGMLDMGSPQFAWMSICCMCCLCCVCLVLLIVAMSA
jgi:hypothetical protein